MRTINRGYQSWNEFIANASRRLTSPSLGTDDATTDRGMPPEWFGATYREALEMATNGWPAGAQEIARELDSLPPSEQPAPEWTMNVAGSFPCVPEYLTGSPECMFQQTTGVRPDHRLTLVVPANYLSHVPAGHVQQYAKAIAAIVRGLEATGISVAVYRAYQSTNGNFRLIFAHAVREHGEPLDLGKIAFAFHPSMLRRLTWAWFDVEPELAAAGYATKRRGTSVEMDDETIRQLMPDLGDFVRMPDINKLHDSYMLRDLPRLIDYMRGWLAGHMERGQ